MADAAARGAGLALALEDAGPSCSSSEAAFREVLKGFPHLIEAGAAEVLSLLVRRSEGLFSSEVVPSGGGLASLNLGDGISFFNVSGVVAGLKAAYPHLDWRQVVGHLDQPGFTMPDAGALKVLMIAYAHATPEPFPLPALVGDVWDNAPGQLSFLKHATAAPPELFTWAHAARRLEPLEGLHAGKSPTGTPNQCWVCLDIYTALASLACSGHAPDVRHLLEHPLKHCPEVLLLGIASVPMGWGPLQQEVCDALVVTYIASHPNSSVVLQRLWPLNRDAVLRGMVALYQKDGTNISRVLDVCQELKGLTVVLDSTPTPFCLELAALAARREYLNLEKWLTEQFTAKGVAFMQASVTFLDSKLHDEPLSSLGVVGAPTARINISVETLAIFLQVLASNAGLLPTDALQQFKVVQTAAVQEHPQLQAVVGDGSSLEAFASDIEEEANAYFQRIYAGELTVEGLVEVLRGFKASTVGREQEVFACMVHNLFDEYRFFPKYPDKELHTTAVLFGQLIHHNLVSSISLGIALRYVLEALRTGPGNKMFRFATTALRQFHVDLAQWSQYTTHLSQVPGLKEAEPELFKSIEAAVAKAASTAAAAAESVAKEGAAANGVPPRVPGAGEVTPQKQLPVPRQDGNAAGFPTSMPSTPSNPNMLFSTINAETLEASAQNVSFPVPDNKVIDRVHFIINNITVANVDVKVKELKQLVGSEFYPWFSNYTVVKRAAQEPNFHGTYVQLVEKWADRELRQLFVNTTMHYVKVMLNSKLLKSSSSERTLLKNLGSWLGKLTLAKNRPVLQRDLDIKAAVLSAYEQGKMLAVLSFVRMLLDPVMDSRIFKPPNPWVMGICSLLAEIYALDNLKTGLKFEVELLFKNLNIQLQDVTPSSLLVGRRRESVDNMDFQAQRPISQGGAAAATPAKASEGGTPTAAGEAKPVPAAPGPMIDPNIIANLHNYIVINPQLAIVGERLQLKRLVPMAIDRAIVEIISPVVDRSVTIACMTTQELVLKDHALEPDAEVLRKSAHLMVTGLAQSLALVTAKEPLRIAVANNLRALLNNQLEAGMLEQVVAMLVGDNLDLCCQVVEKAASERAQREIDERLQGAYASRARAKAVGQQFVDTALVSGRFPAALPEVLRPKPGQLTPQQARVYQEFANIPRTAQAAQAAGAPVVRPGGGLPGMPGGDGGDGGMEPADQVAGPGAPGGAPGAGAAAAPPVGIVVPTADLRTRFITWLQRMDLAIQKEPQTPLAALPEAADLRLLVNEIAQIPGGSEPAALEVAKNVFAKLYQGVGSRAHVTAYAGALEVLRETVLRRLPVELTSWFVQLPEDGKYQKDVGEALVRAGLFYMPELDLCLAKALASPHYTRPAEFTLHLMQQCMIMEPLLSVTDLQHSLDVLEKLAARISGGHTVLQMLAEARRVSMLRTGKPAGAVAPPPVAPPAVAAVVEGPKDPPQLVETVMKLFDRWARLIDENPTEKVHAPFVQELQQSGLLKGDDMLERFIRIMIQLAVQHCIRSESQAAANLPPGAPRPATLSYIAVDACTRLFVCLVVHHGGGPVLFSKILGVLSTQLQRDNDEKGTAFTGRPYFRMAVGFVAELAPADPADEAGMQNLQAMAAFLYSTRALRTPGFAFPWLQLLADRRFMPKLLAAPAHRGWSAYLQLILVQLRFLEPFLRNAELTDAVRLLYKGTLRVLLVLLHDFPEFLCEYHFHLCDHIPPSCIQMRNLVLSAFPRAMRLPDPFTPNLKVDLLPEIAAPPRFVPDPSELLPPPMRADVDAFLARRGNPSAFLMGLRSRLTLSPQDALVNGTKYNVALVNALVFYAGIRAVEASPPKPGHPPAMATPSMELFQHLLRDLDTEGRYLFINALANHLRYPNVHTHYFSCALLFLFAEAGSELIQEQITRVLLERLIVNRPHPWGLLITFIELIKNPRYAFWSHAFTRVAPEIERLFESVARSCMGPQQVQGGAKPEDGAAAALQPALV